MKIYWSLHALAAILLACLSPSPTWADGKPYRKTVYRW